MIWNLVTAKYQSDNSPEHMHSEIDGSKVSKQAAAKQFWVKIEKSSQEKGHLYGWHDERERWL